MSAPKIVYNPGSGNVTLQLVRGPQNFMPRWSPRVHDNLSTSGAARERVVENLDILIDFEMQALVVDDDMPGWMSFMAFALAGGQFQFFPNAALTDYYDCVEESGGVWSPRRMGLKVYAAAFSFRVVNDAQCPADPGVILRRFYGVTS